MFEIKDVEKQSLSLVTDSDTDHEAIRKRAYELYVDRGREDGHDLEDWFRAEEELMSGKEPDVAA